MPILMEVFLSIVGLGGYETMMFLFIMALVMIIATPFSSDKSCDGNDINVIGNVDDGSSCHAYDRDE